MSDEVIETDVIACRHEHTQTFVDKEVKAAGVEATIRVHCKDCNTDLFALMPSGPQSAPKIIWTSNPPQRSAAKKNVPDPSLARSRINRSGLKAGTPAPEFKLPAVDGAEVALANYRGSRLLLVFFANNCKFCDVAAPDLQRLHETGFKVLAIINRDHRRIEEDTAAAMAKVQRLGLTFPVVLQDMSKVGKDYATFDAPVAYVVGPDGVLETDRIVGVPAIPDKINSLIGEP